MRTAQHFLPSLRPPEIIPGRRAFLLLRQTPITGSLSRVFMLFPKFYRIFRLLKATTANNTHKM